MRSKFFFTPYIDQLFSILRDTKRRKLLVILSKGSLTADAITEEMKISRPAVEKHLKQMLDLGVIEREAESVPNLHYLYSIPDIIQDLISNIGDLLDNFTLTFLDDMQIALESEEELLLKGKSTTAKYHQVKRKIDHLVSKFNLDKI